ncbi:TetR/AcrR family transcriptional regulator [Acidiferrimicrobium sp. IK]|uniref:TetR/AcrR family transcriptional regulator n=1 Tax=Acidiferrimicrobium sp. IK TaxID=2871700 RepID=UPI0021CB51D1|nr:helix-turn-helix domain-containing protein [Acidiferrimicrobium sp. IK]MCU4187462.1 TetR/AcrR family transcriptional regulator [Acidiferrimicrobium sp. IK]
MANLRWGSDIPDDTGAARSRLLDAAESCFADLGFSKTTVEVIAQRARASRATVYRYFEGRDHLVLQVSSATPTST